MAETGNILITGASRGLGYALNELYLKKGWTTFPLVRRASAASALQDGAPHRCHPIIADVATDTCVSEIADGVARETDHLDLLINNAGINGRARRIDDVTSDEILELLQIHCLGVIRCTEAVLPQLRAAANAKVINITSRLGSMAKNAASEFSGGRFSYSYRIAKAAQNMFTLCLSQELIKEGIAVYAVHPGNLLTAMAADDANTTPEAAATRLVSWIDRADETMVGRCFDLGNGEMPW